MSNDRLRPYIPYWIRIQVAERQCRNFCDDEVVSIMMACDERKPAKERLRNLLGLLFGNEPYQLDHNPALILRDFSAKTQRYTPDANDPDFLLYRSKHGHHIKTNVKGDGALRSDTAARMHQRRMDENRGKRKRRPKIRIKSRGFTKSQKRPWPKRGFRN